ncbi:MAG: energy transducer TonB [Weeksellaceae bacterium]|nr:energy transducer TonB [Bacteroidota bacterium]MCG2780048.1 energy transducer TonB [Weeksellaceae bacterium]
MKYQLFLLFTFFAFNSYFSQEIYAYPEDQTDYTGGNIQFYKDFRKVIVEKKLQPCSDKNESFNFRVLIYPDKTIKYVKDEDPVSSEQNKCALELSKEVAKYLTGWNPAVIDGKKVPAVTGFWIIPHELFQDLNENYDPVNDMILPEYEGGINKFRQKVFQSIDLTRFKFDGKFKLLVTFIIEADGKMSNIKLVETTGFKPFDDMVITSISKIRNKWTPGSIHGIPVRSRFKLPLAFAMD